MCGVRLVLGWEQLADLDEGTLPTLRSLCRALDMRTYWNADEETLYIESPVTGCHVAVLLEPSNVELYALTGERIVAELRSLLSRAGACVCDDVQEAHLALRVAVGAHGAWGIAATYPWATRQSLRSLAGVLTAEVAREAGLPDLGHKVSLIGGRSLPMPTLLVIIGRPDREASSRMHEPGFGRVVAQGLCRGLCRYYAGPLFNELLRYMPAPPPDPVPEPLPVEAAAPPDPVPEALPVEAAGPDPVPEPPPIEAAAPPDPVPEALPVEAAAPPDPAPEPPPVEAATPDPEPEPAPEPLPQPPPAPGPVDEPSPRLVLEAVTATVTELPRPKPKPAHSRKQARAASARRSTSPPAADPAPLPEPVAPLPPATALVPEPVPDAVVPEPSPPAEAPAPPPAVPAPEVQPPFAVGSMIYVFQWSGATNQRHQAQSISIAKFHRQTVK